MKKVYYFGPELIRKLSLAPQQVNTYHERRLDPSTMSNYGDWMVIKDKRTDAVVHIGSKVSAQDARVAKITVPVVGSVVERLEEEAESDLRKLEMLNKNQLVALAQANGLETRNLRKKVDLIMALMELGEIKFDSEHDQ